MSMIQYGMKQVPASGIAYNRSQGAEDEGWLIQRKWCFDTSQLGMHVDPK